MISELKELAAQVESLSEVEFNGSSRNGGSSPRVVLGTLPSDHAPDSPTLALPSKGEAL